jgi:hypothetical protein
MLRPYWQDSVMRLGVNFVVMRAMLRKARNIYMVFLLLLKT